MLTRLRRCNNDGAKQHNQDVGSPLPLLLYNQHAQPTYCTSPVLWPILYSVVDDAQYSKIAFWFLLWGPSALEALGTWESGGIVLGSSYRRTCLFYAVNRSKDRVLWAGEEGPLGRFKSGMALDTGSGHFRVLNRFSRRCTPGEVNMESEWKSRPRIY